MSILKRTAPALAVALGLMMPAQAQEDPRIPAYALYAEDGARKTVDGPVRFAVIGNTRGSLRALDSRGAVSGVTQELLSDLTVAAAQPEGPDFLVMMGDHVRSGSTLEWRRLGKRLEGLVSSGEEGSAGIPALPVVGDRESFSDERLARWGAAFPGAGVDIGYNRVASWYSFDIVTDGHSWRFVVLDTGKKRLGSRWTEQINWLSEEAADRFDSLVVLMHDPLYDLSGNPMNADDAPRELLETIEESTSLLKIRAVVAAGSHANQVILPDGPFGSLHLNAGGGGAPAMDLRRWGAAEEAQRDEDIHLEPMFDVSLLTAFQAWSDVHVIPESVMNEAQATGSYEGFVGSLSAKYMPTYGWWTVTLQGEGVDLLFRHRLPNGTIEDRYRASFTKADGWKGSMSP